MGIKDIKAKHDEKIKVRDSLSAVGTEIDELEKSEIIQRYNRLMNYYNQNIRLEDKTDDELLDETIQSSDPVPELENTYFCMGRNYFGHVKKIGGYYLAYGSKFKSAVPLAYYKRLTGQPKEELVPLEEADAFEEKHEIIYAETKDPSNEFTKVRRQ